MSGEFSTETLIARFEGISRRLDLVEQQLARVSEKLGVAYVTTASGVPPEVVELARAGKKLDAITKYRELTNANFNDARSVVEGL